MKNLHRFPQAASWPRGRGSGGATAWRVIVPLFALVFLLANPARAVVVTAGSGSGTVGDVITLTLDVDDVTGLGIVAYEVRLSWTSTRATLLDTPVIGTLTEPWGPVTTTIGVGEATIVAAGSTALTGSGALFAMDFELGPSNGNSSLRVDEVVFNEGSPTATLVDGLISVSALPTISISPNSGELAVGETLSFFTSGGSPPYSYSSSDPLVAEFLGADEVLTGLTPGAVSVTSEDDNGVVDTTTGLVDVRALRITAGTVSASRGSVAIVALLVGNTTPYDITSAELEVTFDQRYLGFITAAIAGGVADGAGWSAPETSVRDGVLRLALAGVNELDGPGLLVLLYFMVDTNAPGGSHPIRPRAGMFNEIYPAAHTDGAITVTVPPAINVTPDTARLTVGETLGFGLGGSPTPPISWSVSEPAVALIDASGLLTALAAGQTRVEAADAAGATDVSSGWIEVCDLLVSAPRDTVFVTSSRSVPILVDRDVTGLGIQGYELTINYDATRVQLNAVLTAGTLSESWGVPVLNAQPGRVVIVNAGPLPLSGELPLLELEVQALPDLIGRSSTLEIERAYFNEGSPCAWIENGTLVLPTAAPDLPGRSAVRVDQNAPNPFNPSTRIRYALTASGWATLRIYSASGERVRTLVDRDHPAAGKYAVDWDGRDEGGRRAASGVYFYRLLTREGSDERRMVLLK